MSQTINEMLAPKPASSYTIAANKVFGERLPLDDPKDFEDANRGFIATTDRLKLEKLDDVLAPNGNVAGQATTPYAWNMEAYEFVDAQGPEAPESVNPSLWRQSRLNNINGLFEVVPGIYQVRGFDISNMTIIEGQSGVIVIDPATSSECSAAMLALYRKHRGDRKVTAIIYSHSHGDHFAGVLGVLEEQSAEGVYDFPIIAPTGFMEHAISENVLAGNAMMRRAVYMYGNQITPGVLGQVCCGLGKTVSKGRTGLVKPNVLIERTEETRIVDGVEIKFYLCPDSEAPSEMIMFYPAYRVLNTSEIACKTAHNLLTPRGAQIRDASAWSAYINHCLVKFAAITDVVIAQHHWPTFGQERVREFLEKQRDYYKFVHDQTLRLANHGYRPMEIAERLTLPKSLETEFSVRNYYGTLSFNSRAVFQRYLGWFDGNPANLNPLPPVETAKKEIEYMGGADIVMLRAKRDFDRGEYRFVVQVTNKLVFADPSNMEARALCADAMEQLGYAAESGVWRNFYLQGAHELRYTVKDIPRAPRNRPPETFVDSMSLELVLDFLGALLDTEKAEGVHLVFDLQCTGSGEKRYIMNIQNGALTYTSEIPHGQADIYPFKAADFSIYASQRIIKGVLTGRYLPKDLVFMMAKGELRFWGNPMRLGDFKRCIGDAFSQMFPIVEP